MRHCTDMEVDRQYTDTHGASIVGFAFACMLDFRLMPRLKNIGSAKLYRPAAAEDEVFGVRRARMATSSWPSRVPAADGYRTVNSNRRLTDPAEEPIFRDYFGVPAQSFTFQCLPWCAAWAPDRES
ncbi:Tn3 family transposase [Streptomyces sp. NPDC048297]|uniref:Tn3 family transposase n=1 Tax=Streptomyces sp. NPDC048297 TaxID=3365531 RepID=UPI00371AB1A5